MRPAAGAALRAVQAATARNAAPGPSRPSYTAKLFQGNPMKLTAAKLLETMESDRGYQAGELARRFDTSTAQINAMLCTLVEEGLVRMSSHSSRIIRFVRLPRAPQSCTPSYEGSLQSVRSLAMQGRTSR
jgi:hypothetical protein